MSYTQLTQGERYHIQYLSRHCTVTEIAKQAEPPQKTPSAAKSDGTAPKGSNTAPKKPSGKARLSNSVSDNPISSIRS
ncbi:putative transposase for insertion sequence element IS4351 [Neisseria meningitidis 9506]|nr:putative transposase for insertion sequence element IS4351 [Neisseria meningitidis 9506]